jgi:putative membrane protein
VRHIKLVIFLAILAVGTGLFMKAASNNPSVRGQDPNVETRGTNTGGVPPAPTVGTSGVTWRGDGSWVADAAEMGAAEVALGALAERRATSPDVKALAAELHRDHAAAGSELQSLASRKNWQAPQSSDALHAQALEALDRTQSSEFDRAYVDAMVAAHQKALASFRTAASSATDPDLRAWSAKQIPALEQHLEHAQRLKK